MPYISSTTDLVLNSLISEIATQYQPNSTITKPRYRVEQLVAKAISQPEISDAIQKYVLMNLHDYE